MASLMHRVDMLKGAMSRLAGLDRRLDSIKLNQGMILSELHRTKQSPNLNDYEFTIYSQSGEDGIIQRLINIVPIKNKTFIEFGVQSFSESNCRFLMMKDNWSGLVMDGSEEYMNRLRNSYYFWMHDLTALSAFITRENINELLARGGADPEPGILSIDIDGNDYWVWEAITGFSPAIVIVEYNSRFGPDRAVVVPYDPNFVRSKAHYSLMYFGASLAAFCQLGKRKGYCFVGCNSTGNNAFFVRRDLRPASLPELDASEGFVRGKFRDTRTKSGDLAFLTQQQEESLLQELPLVELTSI